MLFKLAIKNIRKSIKDYAIYFFTLVLGVAVFYVFSAMEASTVMVNLSASQRQIVSLMEEALGGISIFISFVLGFLIIYASRFLMRRRKKEFAIYMTLGMGKRDITRVLLFETVFIGLLSLVVGLLIGIGASQFMSLLVARMFEVDMSSYQFVFSLETLLKTMLYFAIIYVIVMIFSTFSISRGNLYDMLNADRKNETVKLKKTWISIILFIISISVLSYAYYMVTGVSYSMITNEKLGIAILLGCIGTFLFFYSLSGFALKLMQLNKAFYHRKLNMFVARQMNSKINTTVFSMTVISLMLFLTICILSSGISINQSMTQGIRELTPVDFQINKVANLPVEGNSEDIVKYSNTSLYEDLKEVTFDPDKYLKDSFAFHLYKDESLTFESLLGIYSKEVEKKYPELSLVNQEPMIKLSDYNKIAKRFHKKSLALGDGEYAVVADFDEAIKLFDASLKNKTKIVLNGKTYSPKYDKCQLGFIEIAASPTNGGIVVMPDEALSDDMISKSQMMADYQANDEAGKQKIEDVLMNIHSEIQANMHERYYGIRVTTKIGVYESSVGLGAMVTFIGLYLGIVFLITSAAILALKELSESTDNKQRYMILRKIGVNEKTINHSLFAQITIFFLLPVCLAIVHSIFGMEFATIILSVFGKSDLLASSTLTGLFILLIYGGYLLITYFCSKNIIKDN